MGKERGGRKMLVYKEQVEAYRIGTNLFLVDEEAFLREVRSGRFPNDEEWEVYRNYEKERFEKQKEQEENDRRMYEEYERRIQEEERRHEEEKQKIHFELFGN